MSFSPCFNSAVTWITRAHIFANFPSLPNPSSAIVIHPCFLWAIIRECKAMTAKIVEETNLVNYEWHWDLNRALPGYTTFISCFYSHELFSKALCTLSERSWVNIEIFPWKQEASRLSATWWHWTCAEVSLDLDEQETHRAQWIWLQVSSNEGSTYCMSTK